MNQTDIKITIRLLTVIFLSVITFPAHAQSDADRSMLRNEIEKDLTENILSFRMEMPDHPKGGVLNARILWTFSHAYGQYGLEEYRRIADNAQRELIAIKDGTKQTSILSYGIFGLSEHFRVTGEKESLDAAIGIFRTLEDNVSKGADMETHMNLLEACRKFCNDNHKIATA